MTDIVLLKDHLFNRLGIEQIADEISAVYPDFPSAEFIETTLARFPMLELKARIYWIAECLQFTLPRDYLLALSIIVSALPPPNNPALSDGDFGNIIYAAYGEFVARFGCYLEVYHESIDALYHITQRVSAEDAIRSFINMFPDDTVRYLTRWTSDSHYHVRRLCSEGTRPKLPWSRKLSVDYLVAAPILEQLFSDRTRYVTRSVANHLNDISKIDPDWVCDTLKRWRLTQRQTHNEMEYIVRHSLRTLVKLGHPEALRMMGASTDVSVRVIECRVPTTVAMNQALECVCVLNADCDATVIVDYIVFFQNKKGLMTNKKTYKWGRFVMAGGRPLTISKSHKMRGSMTTRRLIKGDHAIEILVNGVPSGYRRFAIV